jgi:HK97 family phage portal protein
VRLLGRIADGFRPQASFGTIAGYGAAGDPFVEAFKQGSSSAGRVVTVEGAFAVAAVWAAVRVLADTIGSLPLHAYRTRPSGREKAEGTRVYRLLHDEPNPEMPASALWSVVATHLNTWGNAYLGKTFRGSEVIELWPIRPDRVKVRREKGRKVFVLTDEGGRETDRRYSADEIVHLFGLSLDGLTGLSPVACARESIGAAIAMDEWQNSFFRDGALPRMALIHKERLSDKAKDNLRRQWEQRYRGSKKANRVAVLEEGVTVETLSLPQRDLEFVNQRKHSIQEIARWFRVPVSLVEGDKGGSLQYSTVEMDNLHFAVHSVRPWLVRIEQSLNRDKSLFPSGRLFSEFSIDALLRADTKTRYESYQIALDPISGWMKPREVRELENLPPDSSFEVPTREQLLDPAAIGD